MMSVLGCFTAFGLVNVRKFTVFFVFIGLFIFYSSDVFAQSDCVDMKPHRNGGGLVASTAYVAAQVFVHPAAKVCGNAKVNNGNIRGKVLITGGTINGGEIGGGNIITTDENGRYIYRFDPYLGEPKISGGTIYDGVVGGNAEVSGGVIQGGEIKGHAKFKDGLIESGVVGGRAEVSGGIIQGGEIKDDAKVKGGRIRGSSVVSHRSEVSDGVIENSRIGSSHSRFALPDVDLGPSENDVKIKGGTIKNSFVNGGEVRGKAIVENNSIINSGIVGENSTINSGTVNGGYVGGNAVVQGHVSGNAHVTGGIIQGRVEGDAKVTGGVIEKDMKLSSGTFTSEDYRQHVQRRKGIISRTRLAVQRSWLRLKMGNAAKGAIGVALALATVASEVVRGETHILETPARLADESGFSTETGNSDTVKYTIDDILEELKTNVQGLDPETRFSEERQMLSNKLRTLYTDVQVDTGLSDEEKQQHLKTIAEIQDIAQPSSPTRRPPNRRNRSRGQSSQGLQGSLDDTTQKDTEQDNVTENQPARGLALTGMCLSSDRNQVVSHQCLRQCACLLMQSQSRRTDTNQKPVD